MSTVVTSRGFFYRSIDLQFHFVINKSELSCKCRGVRTIQISVWWSHLWEFIYIGQKAFDHLLSLYMLNTWNKSKFFYMQFTVEAVVTESVSVHWQCRALCTHCADQVQPQQPKFLVEGIYIRIPKFCLFVHLICLIFRNVFWNFEYFWY